MFAVSLATLSFQPNPVVLATFDKATTSHTWQVMNDPVMGGQSHSTFAQEGGIGNFTGLCAIVPFLKAPGFCKIGTTHGLLSPPGFDDASAFIDGSLYITAKSSTPAYKGFKVDFGAKNVTRPRPGMHHGPPSFKADFQLPASAADDYVTV